MLMNGMLNLRFSVLLGTLVVSGLAGCTQLDRDSDDEPPELSLPDGFRSEVLYQSHENGFQFVGLVGHRRERGLVRI